MAATAKWTMDSKEAHNYMINPLIAPDPSDETGLNSSFRSTFARPTESRENLIREQKLLQQDKFQQQKLSSAFLPNHSSPLAPSSAGRQRSSSNASPPSSLNSKTTAPIRRGQSLNHGSGHNSRRKHRHRVSLQPIDPIDSLDFSPGGPYHHEGPYDSTLLARNMNFQTSPVAAVAASNAAALKATPREKIMDSVLGHRPLDGVASVPPGTKDELGRKYSYEEENEMAAGGYGRLQWIGPDLDEGQKAMLDSEPAWKLGNDYPSSLNEQSSSRGIITTSGNDIELKDSIKQKKQVGIQEQEIGEDGMGPSRRHSLREGLKRRIGSLRRKND